MSQQLLAILNKRKMLAPKKGFTLLEVVVALAVILGALIGPVALVTRGLFDFSLIKNKLVALNLAQEGIEIVRAVRENNILCQSLNTDYISNFNTGYSWVTNSNGLGLLTDSPQPRKVDARQTDTITSPACNPPIAITNITNPRTNIAGNCSTEPLNFSQTNGYSYISGDPASQFSRCVTISYATAAEDNIPANQMIDVVSRVEWLEHGVARSVELRERLYKWKYPLSN